MQRQPSCSMSNLITPLEVEDSPNDTVSLQNQVVPPGMIFTATVDPAPPPAAHQAGWGAREDGEHASANRHTSMHMDKLRWKRTLRNLIAGHVKSECGGFEAKSTKLAGLIENRHIRLKESVERLEQRKVRKEKVISSFIYLFFCVSYFYIVLAQARVEASFKLEYAISNQIWHERSSMANTLKEVSSLETMWDWIETALLPGVLDAGGGAWYNGDVFDDIDSNYFLLYNRMVGGLKLVSRRVDPCSCVDLSQHPSIRTNSSSTVLTRYAAMHAASSSRAFCSNHCSERFKEFYPILFPPFKDTYKSSARFGPKHDPNKYRFQNDVWGGGFFIFTDDDPEFVFKVIEEIKRDLFVDKSSRQLKVTFTVYNGNYHLFTTAQIVFGLEATGLIRKSVVMKTFAIEHYLTTEDHVRGAFECIFAGYVVWSVLDLLRDIWRIYKGDKRRSVMEFWFWLDFIRVVLHFTLVVQWIRIINDISARDLKLPLNAFKLAYDFEPLLKKHDTMMVVNSFCAVVSLLTCLKYFHYYPKFGIMVRTISKAAPQLGTFMLMFTMVFFVFDIMGMMMFGKSLEEWSTFFGAFQTLTMMMTAEYGMEPLISVDDVLGTTYYFFFLVIAYFLLINILLAILLDAYAALNEENMRAAELEEDTLNMIIPKEILLSYWIPVQGFFLKLLDPNIEVREFYTVEKYLEMLTTNYKLKEQAYQELPKPTINHPNPEPEYILTFDMVVEAFGDKPAHILMAALGKPLSAEDWEKIQEMQNEGNPVVKDVSGKHKVLNTAFSTIMHLQQKVKEQPAATRQESSTIGGDDQGSPRDSNGAVDDILAHKDPKWESTMTAVSTDKSVSSSKQTHQAASANGCTPQSLSDNAELWRRVDDLDSKLEECLNLLRELAEHRH